MGTEGATVVVRVVPGSGKIILSPLPWPPGSLKGEPDEDVSALVAAAVAVPPAAGATAIRG
jgi:hypothetical protein